MPELAKFTLESGGSVHVDVEEGPGVKRVARDGKIPEARKTFEAGLHEVRNAATIALAQFRAMARQPDEVEITFGVRMDVQIGAVIAKTGTAGNFEVKLTWRSNDRSTHDETVSSPEAAELKRSDPVA
ncbi:MAG TPA: CU044_2847 family protein [Pseudonocardiaceae bacterium]